ncbi:hypothetical protein ATSB10_06240 [Dyella thiooxydans]|uniref:Uncharacterized protein n=1 Tax=Dyella thiooxydans TaxID=445710 RepID=A0A160MZ07_9GAMM|nr:hypothetical protein [Dyella thiooxydans]AND68078.1 hypothetical protein ATSB10_06240 [Dyella thiooxydans]
MNMKALGGLSAIVGVVIASFSGSAIARHTGLGAEGWLLAAFALGIVLLGQGSVLRLQEQVQELQARLARSENH